MLQCYISYLFAPMVAHVLLLRAETWAFHDVEAGLLFLLKDLTEQASFLIH